MYQNIFKPDATVILMAYIEVMEILLGVLHKQS